MRLQTHDYLWQLQNSLQNTLVLHKNKMPVDTTKVIAGIIDSLEFRRGLERRRVEYVQNVIQRNVTTA